MLSESVRAAVEEILFENSVLALERAFPKDGSISSLLCLASSRAYNDALLVQAWMSNSRDCSEVGAMRSPNGYWGRYFDVTRDDTDINSEVSCLPISTAHEGLMKYVCSKSTCDKVVFPSVYGSLTRVNPSMRTVWFSPEYGEPIQLSTLYYEQSDILVDVVRKLHNGQSVAENADYYRAVFHTPISNHQDIVRYLDDNMFVLHGSNNAKKVEFIKLTYWLLCHSTLYYQGSDIIARMVCSILWDRVYHEGVFAPMFAKDIYIEALLCQDFKIWSCVFRLMMTTKQIERSTPVTLQVRDMCKFVYANVDTPPQTLADIQRNLVLRNAVDTYDVKA